MVANNTSESLPTERQSASAIFDVLGDPDSRQILCCLAREPMVITEIVDRFGLSRELASRKVDALATPGLVSGRLRLDPPGPAVTEYVTPLGSITVSLAGDGPGLSLWLGDRQRPLVADGGQESTDDGQKQLKDLFCTVTGTDEVTEQQETDNRRFVAEQGEESLAGDVADVAREDGLDDTLPEPDPGGSE